PPVASEAPVSSVIRSQSCCVAKKGFHSGQCTSVASWHNILQQSERRGVRRCRRRGGGGGSTITHT
ncbi:unnamed protein product, partial [Heterosigma akashiwo]